MLQSIKWKIFLEVFTEILVNFRFFYPLKIVAFLNADSWKPKYENVQPVLCDRCKTHFLVLKNDFPHAEVEHGADVDDEEEGAHHGEGEDGGAGGAGVRLCHRAEDLLTGPGPVYCVHFEICHWGKIFLYWDVIW